MSKIMPSQPLFVMLYGYPGAGKTYFSRQLSERILAAHLESDRIRSELFEQPSYSKQENSIVDHLMNYMAGEFLAAGVSVIYDSNSMRVGQRRTLRDMARAAKATPLVVWFQMDPDTAFGRQRTRDHRKLDDRYAPSYNADQFQSLLNYMQNPELTEDFVVVSGKHTFPTQLSAVMKKLFDMGVVRHTEAAQGMTKPELVNLVPKPQQHLLGGKRNIVLR